MGKENDVVVSIAMGSDSDFDIMQEAGNVLANFGVSYEFFLTSAHRSPERTEKYAKELKKRGVKIVIVGAGMAAHLAGVIAANCELPIIGVPIDSSPLKGLDALLATLQMPPGIPVATMAIGKAGAKNAALLAIRILALHDANLAKKLSDFIAAMAKEVEEKHERVLAR